MMSYMAKVYADLIRKGKKTLEDVPEKLKEEVQQVQDEMIQAVDAAQGQE